MREKRRRDWAVTARSWRGLKRERRAMLPPIGELRGPLMILSMMSPAEAKASVRSLGSSLITWKE